MENDLKATKRIRLRKTQNLIMKNVSTSLSIKPLLQLKKMMSFNTTKSLRVGVICHGVMLFSSAD